MDWDRENEEQVLDFRQVFGVIVKNWIWFVVTLITFLLAAFLWNMLSIPVYKLEAKVLVNEEGSTFMDPRSLVSQSFIPNSYKVRKEMQILGSYTLAKEAAKNLPLEASWWVEEGFKPKLVYPPPFRVLLDSSYFQSLGEEIELEVLDSLKVSILFLDEEQDVTYTDTIALGTYFECPSFRFKLFPGTTIPSSRKYKFRIHGNEWLQHFYSRVDIREEKSASVIRVSLEDQSATRAVAYLNALTQQLLKREVRRKNQIALNTIAFIEAQLQSVNDSLRTSESKLEEFRRVSGVTNLDFQSQQTFEVLEGLEKEKASLAVFLNYYDYLKNSIATSKDLNKLIVPSSMGIYDDLLNKLVLDLMDLYSDKAEVMINSKRENPMLGAVEHRIEELKKNILETINGLIYSSNLSMKNIDERLNRYKSMVSQIPEKERMLLSFQRRFNLNNEIYTFLLTKRSELQISAASNFPENEILDPAYLNRAIPVSPNKRLNYLIALLFGLAAPFVFFHLKAIVLDKVEEQAQLEKLGLPLMGELIHSDDDNDLFAVASNPVSLFADNYRTLRTNVKLYITQGEQARIVLISSSFASEGKSFVSRNLAASFAQAGHKTVLVNVDLRKSDKVKVENGDKLWGLSAYLSKNIDLKDLIVKTSINGLSYIPSGVIPPNPTELIDSLQMQELLASLKNDFDIIIIDTPPIGMIADSLILAQYSDLILFVVRFKHSRFKTIGKTLAQLRQTYSKKVALVANDIKPKYYGYGYYNYGYYSNGKKGKG